MARISGFVSAVTVTDRGYGFEPGEPVYVIFSGGGGDGAVAIASVGTAGSGAAATARINGSVVAVKVDSQGGGYQTSPSVSVDMTNNFLATDPSDPSFLPYIQVRIAGRVSGVEIVEPGSNYGTRDDRFNIFQKPPWATATAGPLGGPITAVSYSQAGLTGFYSAPPRMNFENTIVPYCEVSCLTGAFSIDVGDSGGGPRRSGASYRLPAASGDTSADTFRPSSVSSLYLPPGANTNSLVFFSMLGAIGTTGNCVGFGPTQRNISFLASIQRSLSVLVMPVYSPSELPTVFVVDASGSGAVAEMQSPGSLVVTSPGENYTLDATFYMRGGRPVSWGSPPAGSVAISSQTGKIVGGITWDSQGDGNGATDGGACADVYLDGGGSEEGDLSPAGVLTPSASPFFFSFSPSTSFGVRSFKSPPRVIVVTREKPSHRHGTANRELAASLSLSLTQAAPESIRSEATSATAITTPGFSRYPAEAISSPSFGDGWNLFLHHWDGQVNFVWIDYPSQARAFGVSSPPAFSFSLGGGGSGAAAHAEIVGWTGHFSDERAMRVIST